MSDRVQGEVRVPVNLAGLNYMVTPAQAEHLAQEGWLEPDADDLDAAWADAEAALPEGESIASLTREWMFVYDERGLPTSKRWLPLWHVYAGLPYEADWYGRGPTPAAALRALAAARRASGPTT